MVEAELLNTLQSISYIAGATGVRIAAFYYVMVLREQRRNTKQNLDTRQFQLLMQISQHDMSKEGILNKREFGRMEWTDYEDFVKKYDSDVNPNNYAIRERMATYFTVVGILVKNDMIDRNIVFDYFGWQSIRMWNKFKDIVEIQRRLYKTPKMYEQWEYLYDEMAKIAKSRDEDTSRKWTMRPPTQ